MPRQIELAKLVLAQTGDFKLRQHASEILAVQNVEFAVCNAAGTHFLHGGLVFIAPRFGKFGPIEGVAAGLEDFFRLARDRGSPIDQCAENVKE